MGEKAYLRCMTGHVMDRSYDKTLLGLPVTCGNQGKWEMEYDLYSIDPCTKTPMCSKPLAESPSGDLRQVAESLPVSAGPGRQSQCEDHGGALQ